LFTSEIFLVLGAIIFSFLFDKYCPIIEELGSKDLSRDLQLNCTIIFYFYLYLILYVCVVRLDMT
jgi:hypothetical protein